MTKRHSIPKRIRWRVLERDGFACRYCGTHAGPEVVLHIDHIIPVSKGGTNAPDNLTAACRDCNLGKFADDSTIALTATERIDRATADALAAEMALDAAIEEAEYKVAALRYELECAREGYRSSPTHIADIMRRVG